MWQEAVAAPGARWREQELGRARRAPRHAILDSQSVKAAAEGEERGFPGGKKSKGRSRHVAIDSQGTLLAVHVRAANKADGAGGGGGHGPGVRAASLPRELHRRWFLPTPGRAGRP